MSRVSVVIPSYNQGRYLPTAVESVLAQTAADVEVIVVDDGSSDDTAQVCEALGARPGVRVIRQENAGVGAARNRGAAASQADYLCFLDADDYYDPEKIARQARVLDESPAVDWVYCDICTVDDGGVAAAEQYSVAGSRQTLNGDILESLIIGGYFPPHTVMMRRSTFQALGGFDPALGGNCDLDLWLRAAAAGHRVEFVNARLASYRTHADSMSRDAAHMRATREAAYAKVAQLHPQRVGQAISRLQEVHEDLSRGNQWLHETLQQVAAQIAEPLVLGSLMADAAAGRMTANPPESAALWDVMLNEAWSRALVLHPPASLVFDFVAAGDVTVRGAVALHPDVWDHPESGACRFQVTADERVVWATRLDPATQPGDRRWVEFSIDVPASPSGRHQVRLETEAGENPAFRWALWRTLEYVQARFSSQKLQPNAG